jgi:hypothetical protein
MKDEEDLEALLGKVVDFAVQRGILKPTERKSALGQALIHHGDKRAFLRKLIERKGKLTTDEAMRLEKEALAPPPPPPSKKPLPSLTSKKNPERKKSSRRVISSSPLPSLNAPKEGSGPKEDVTVHKKKLPSLGTPKRDELEVPRELLDTEDAFEDEES